MPNDRCGLPQVAVLVALMTVICAAEAVAAADQRAAAHSRVRLIAAGSVAAMQLARRTDLSEPLLLAGVEFALEPGWKTYWRSPGDGIAPEFDWSKSTNVAATQVLWPVPKHFSDIAGTYNGYRGGVLLPVVVTPKRPGAPVSLNLRLDYAVCKDVCIPVTKQLSVRLVPDQAKFRSSVLAALHRTPMRADTAGRCEQLGFERVSARLSGDSPALEVTVQHPRDAAPHDLFVEASTGQFLPHPERVRTKAGRTRYHLDLSASFEPSALAGATITLMTTSPGESCEMAWTVE